MNGVREIRFDLTSPAGAGASHGDFLLTLGRLYTARDAAIKRLLNEIEQGKPPPFDADGAFIYFAGPTGAPPGLPIGAIGPTTSGRMERYLERLFKLGVRGFVGKGGFGSESAGLFKKYGGFYLCAVGGAGALYAGCVKKAEIVAYSDLGCEAIRYLEIENMPLICGIDSHGKSIFN